MGGVRSSRSHSPDGSSILQEVQHFVKSIFAPCLDCLNLPAKPSLWLTASDTTAQTVGKIAVSTAVATATTLTLNSLYQMVKWRRKLRVEKTNDVAPGPAPLPFLGNVPALRTAYYKTLFRYVHEPASVFWVLSTPFVVVNDEVGLRRVLGGDHGLYTKPKYFGYRSRTVASAVQAQRATVASESIAYEPNGDASRVALDDLVRVAFPRLKGAMHALLRDLERMSHADVCSEGRSLHVVRRGIVRLNLSVLFGARLGGVDGEDADRISQMIGFAGTEFARRMVNPLKVYVDWVGNFRFFREVGALMALGRRLCRSLDECAARADGVRAEGVSWVHAWIGKVGAIGKLGKTIGLLMASTQTVPLTAVWLLHLVGNDKDVRAKVLHELSSHGINSIADLEYDQLDRLEYTNAVIKETMRLYPPFPLIQRQAQRANTLCGLTIPAGTIVYVVPWLVHRNERFWRDAHQFVPERFLEKGGLHGNAPSDWVYLPFGRGSRMCAGSKLAMAELKVLLVHAVLSFEWTSSRSLEENADERFPELGMVPHGVELCVKSDVKAKAFDHVLTA